MCGRVRTLGRKLYALLHIAFLLAGLLIVVSWLTELLRVCWSYNSDCGHLSSPLIQQWTQLQVATAGTPHEVQMSVTS